MPCNCDAGHYHSYLPFVSARFSNPIQFKLRVSEMSIFDRRVAFKPFEYSEVPKFKDAIQKSYWTVNHFDFNSDVHEFNSCLEPHEQNAIKRTLLAISQIEVSVKKFWANIGDRFPKAEFEQVGICFADSEIRHSDAYSKLLEVLSLNNEFEKLLENPVILGRVDYLTKYLKGASSFTNEKYTLTLTLFSIFIENVSLFSQFLIIKSFDKRKRVLKNIDNVVQATAREEVLHAMFGAYLVNAIKSEYPEWFGDEFYQSLYHAARKAYDAESKIIDWIFEQGELSFMSKAEVLEFTKDRFNESLKMIGGAPQFEVDKDKLKNIQWFTEEIESEVSSDFFFKHSTNYSKFAKTYSTEDLF